MTNYILPPMNNIYTISLIIITVSISLGILIYTWFNKKHKRFIERKYNELDKEKNIEKKEEILNNRINMEQETVLASGISYEELMQIGKVICKDRSMQSEQELAEASKEPIKADNKKNDDTEKEPVIEIIQQKRRLQNGYKAVFLNPRELKTRQCVYVSTEMHKTVQAIVSEIAVKGMSVGAFIDTVLRQHLEEHKDEINNLYRRKREDLIK